MEARRSSARGVKRATTAISLGGSLLVGGVALAHAAWRGALSPGLVFAIGGAAALALFGSHLLARRSSQPRLRRISDLAARIRRRAERGFDGEAFLRADDEEEFAEVVAAVDALVLAARERTRDLLTQAEVLRSLLELSPNAVLMTDAEGRIRYLNPTFRRLVRLRGDPVGHLPIEAVPLVEVQTVVDRALGGHLSEDVACTSDPYELVLQAVPTRDGGALVIAQDVTRFRLAERARTDFVANVSHELRTPMTAILGFAEALLDDAARLPPDAVPMLERIYRNAKRLRDIFEDLLTLSRIEARRGELPMEVRHLRPILAEAVAAAADTARQRGIDFELQCKGSLTASCNAEALSAIVANLAANAVHYTHEGGHVQIHARPEGRWVRIDVVDDGIGIDPAHHQRIFERFYRVDEGRSRGRGGTGLGLAIVKHLAMASKARVSVASEKGKGSAFTVLLPAA